jgi:hypothetical protein
MGGRRSGLFSKNISEVGDWSVGVSEYWSAGFEMHHSIIPSLRYSTVQPPPLSSRGDCAAMSF